MMKNLALAAIAAVLIFVAIDSTLDYMAKEEAVASATSEKAEPKK